MSPLNLKGRRVYELSSFEVEDIAKLILEEKLDRDYFVGKTSLELDTNALKRVEEVSKLGSEERDRIFMVIDALIRDFKTKKVFPKKEITRAKVLYFWYSSSLNNSSLSPYVSKPLLFFSVHDK